MATYAVGDVQGCYAELCDLLEKIHFDPTGDCLWLLGDLINRGPDSLSVVRLVRSFGESARTVLGNHDLHFLAIHIGGHSLNRNDTFVDLLHADDVDDIAEWLCEQPFLVRDDELGFAMTHAGIPHIWSVDVAEALAAEVEKVIRGKRRLGYFETMYGNKPDTWSDSLKGMDRWRAITNYLTRMRLMDEDGRMDFAHKGGLSDAPPEWVPWFEIERQQPLPVKLLFGHWAAIEGHTGRDEVIALDTGCVWGRELTALCLETGELIAVPSRKRA
jgi:bis(5'-nucleosyl)-tetraphosphatase (symmetrical)